MCTGLGTQGILRNRLIQLWFSWFGDAICNNPDRLDGIVIKLYFLISYKQQQVATLRRGNGKKRAEKARVGQFPLLFFVKPIFTSEEDMYETGEFQSNSFLIGKVDLSIQLEMLNQKGVMKHGLLLSLDIRRILSMEIFILKLKMFVLRSEAVDEVFFLET
ncbi:hypothetical protein C5167_042310 [Papaver somniferum]|uniref:Uncharacterized protein n=1 Tax=Papaver somniferum TaxID=3469 RepID=A0A4Y7L2F4_PAPSO|nr:hypothetical protein C5167_042310 [Papaver somniferum]